MSALPPSNATMTDEEFGNTVNRHLRSDDDATCFLVQKSECENEFKRVNEYLEKHQPVNKKHDKGFSIAVGDEAWRVQAVRCLRAKAWSITVRRKSGKTKDAAIKVNWLRDNVANGFAPKPAHVYKGKVSLVSFEEVINAIVGLLSQEEKSSWKGFLYITGGTEAGKTNVAQGLIFRYLNGLLASVGQLKRRPHLVTFEDPIEDLLLSDSMLCSDDRAIDYTPRQKHLDCESLRDCTTSALRQTPSALYCGELRDRKDLREAVRFGGTGHFAVATGHAGSLTEAASHLMSATQATTPSERAIWWPKVLGIVHLKRVSLEIDGSPNLGLTLLFHQCTDARSAVSKVLCQTA